MKHKIFGNIVGIFFIMIFSLKPLSASYDKSFFDYKIKSIDGNLIDLNNYKNKVVLLVNVASYCGFTNQYQGLQDLWETYNQRGFIVLGVPSKSFGQEKDDEKEVKDFCKVNFNITFPLTSIYEVKGDNAHDIYKWAKRNYGNKSVPKWNFYKILINKDGKIVDTFSSFTKPTSNKVKNAIENYLK